MTKKRIVWTTIVGLLLVIIGAGLLTVPNVALQYWYLLAVPLLLASFNFGIRGAALVSGLSLFVLLLIFRAAGQTFAEVGALANELVASSTSPVAAGDLVLRLVDLQAMDPRANFARAMLGMSMVVVVSLMVGISVDTRDRAYGLLQRAFYLLRQYFSPQVVETILSQPIGAHLSTVATRKEITVLFADLRGFTALSERLEPEDVHEVLREFFTAMTDEVFREDGTLDKYIGDGLMAFFGDPMWYPDHPERAFRAAVAMQRRMRELQAAWGSQGRPQIAMGIGVATGHAVVGNSGSDQRVEYTAIGATVNVASRLTDIAPGGQILTTRKTFWRVHRAVDGVPRGSTEVKGFSQPVEIVEVTGIRSSQQTDGRTAKPGSLDLVARVVNDASFRTLLLTAGEDKAGVQGLSDEEWVLAEQVALLIGFPTFQDLPAEEIAMLFEEASVERVAPGTILTQQGATEDRFYVILEGDVIVTVQDETQPERHIASLTHGDYFGEVSLLYDTPRTATVRASTPTTILVLQRDNFFTLLTQAPNLESRIETAASGRAHPLLEKRPLARTTS